MKIFFKIFKKTKPPEWSSTIKTNKSMAFSRRNFLHLSGMATAGFLLPHPAFTQNPASVKLPRSTPEAQGVSSKGILDFLEALEKSVHEFHGMMLLRNGQVVTEGWWSPYRSDLKHSLYSMSKSFTSSAIGFAVAEGRLKLSDKVISFFPDQLPETVSEHLRSMTVQHLLMMSAGHATDTTWEVIQQQNWVKAFLAQPVEHQPGSVFLYNSGATYMCSAILQKVTGEHLLDWLTPRLFKPLGIEGATWDADPQGIHVGGWGLRLKTEDLAKFGQLYLQKGKWDSKQILPESWVEEATSLKISNGDPSTPSDWAQGYCYQFWRCRHNAYRGDGAFGQYTIVMPEQNAVLAIMSETPNMQGILDLVYEHLLPAMREKTLPADVDSQKKLGEKLAALRVVPPSPGQKSSPLAASISGKTFKMEANEMQVKSVCLEFKKGKCLFRLNDHNGEHKAACGMNNWVWGKVSMPGAPPDLFPRNDTVPPRLSVAGNATWKTENTLEMTLQYYDIAHHDTITCRFDGDRVEVKFLNSVAELVPDWVKEKRGVLTGKKGN